MTRTRATKKDAPIIFQINGEIHSSKNSRIPLKNGKVIKSKAARDDENMIGWQLLEQKEKWDAIPKVYPLYVRFLFRRKTKARWDFVNLVQGVADAMVKTGYIPDDDVLHFIPVYRGFEINKECPGVDFYIMPEMV